MDHRLIAATALSLLALCNAARAEGVDTVAVGLGVSAGTLGIGPELEGRFVNAPFGLRLGGNFLNISHGFSAGSLSYAGKLDLSNGGLIADWYPWASGFRFSAGLKYDDNSVTVTAMPNGAINYRVNGTTYSALGSSINGKVDFNKAAPYFGLGFGGTIGAGITAGFDLGALYVGSPNTSLTASGAITSVPGFGANLASEQSSLQSKVNDFRFYPVVQFGLGYRF